MEKSEARLNKEDFLARVNAEFGGIEEWDKVQKEVAAQTGGDHVYVARDVLATRLAREGYLVTLHIGRTRFMTKLRPEDVGLNPKDPRQQEYINTYLSLGQKFLIPGETLRSLDRIESKMRRLVDVKYGIPTVAGVFVPYKNLEPMKKEIESLKAEYFAIRDEILANYEVLKIETKEAYAAFAVEVYRLLRKDPAYNPTPEEVKSFVDATMSYFPTPAQVRSSFYVNVEVGVVQTTAFLAEQEARLRLVQEREEVYRRELALIEQKITEEERRQRRLEAERLRLEQERYKSLIAQEQAKQKAIEEAVAQARAEYLPQMEQIFADLAGAVHGIIYDTLTRVTKALETNGALRPADSKSLSCLVEKVRTLAFNPDPEVEAWIEKIKAILDVPADKRNPDDVKYALNKVRAEAAQVILSIGRAPRTLRGAEMSDLEQAVQEAEYSARQLRPQLTLEDAFEEAGEPERLSRNPRMLMAV